MNTTLKQDREPLLNKGEKMLQLTASDFYTLYRPDECENRVYFRHKGLEEAPPSPYEEVI